jgi:CubicO group peptidase (beta-lactamase class C family)
MKDTDFFVPAEKLSRLATVYTVAMEEPSSLKAVPREAGVSKEPGFPSGGGGLYSTAHDYLRFAQMLLNGGELDGVRILAPSSVQLMRTNHLPDDLLTKQFGVGNYHFQPGLGYGYDVAVLDNPPKLGDPAGRGTFSWDGATGVWFWIDPTNDVVFIGMIQRGISVPQGSTQEDLSRALLHQPDFVDLSSALVYQALIRPEE